MTRIGLLLLAVGSLALGGCGTFADAMAGPVDDHVYYRGVRLDVEAVSEGGKNVLMAADIPLSAIVDTALLPYLAYHEWTDPPRKIAWPLVDESAINDRPPR